jgi:hypothetical protein
VRRVWVATAVVSRAYDPCTVFHTCRVTFVRCHMFVLTLDADDVHVCTAVSDSAYAHGLELLAHCIGALLKLYLENIVGVKPAECCSCCAHVLCALLCMLCMCAAVKDSSYQHRQGKCSALGAGISDVAVHVHLLQSLAMVYGC